MPSTLISMKKSVFISVVAVILFACTPNQTITPTVHAVTVTPSPYNTSLPPTATETATPIISAPTPILEVPGMMHWPIPPEMKYAIDFDSNIWEFSYWDERLPQAWQLTNRRLVGCKVDIPIKATDDQGSFSEGYFQTLGSVVYDVRKVSSEGILQYVIYNPHSKNTGMNLIFFRVVFGDSSPKDCIQDSEMIFTTLHLDASPHIRTTP